MKRISNTSYAYHIFAKNIPFKLEKDDVVLEKYHDEYEKMHNFSFIKMNDDFIELIDQHYAWLGKGVGLLLFSFCIIAFPFILTVMSLLTSIKTRFDSIDYFFYPFMFTLSALLPFLFFYLIKKYDFSRDICSPILMNRKNQKVYFYVNQNEYIERNWQDVTWVIGESDGAGGMHVFGLLAYVVEDGILKETFLIGFPTIGKRYVFGLWNCIYTFMNEGPESLYPTRHPMYGTIDANAQLTYCQRMIGRKESLKDSWQSMRLIYAGLFIYQIFTYPLDVFTFLGRRILLRLRPIPVRSQKMRDEVEYDKERPEQIDYKNNFKFTWKGMKD